VYLSSYNDLAAAWQCKISSCTCFEGSSPQFLHSFPWPQVFQERFDMATLATISAPSPDRITSCLVYHLLIWWD
jgi:hypothetical protein